VNARAAVNLALLEALDLAHPPDLRPLLHAKQRLPPVSIVRSSQINGRSDTSDPAPRVDHLYSGADGPVFIHEGAGRVEGTVTGRG
jgi:hypothetical protein